MVSNKGLLNLSEQVSFYFSRNNQQNYGFWMISGVIEVNLFAKTRIILEAKYGKNFLAVGRSSIKPHKKSQFYHVFKYFFPVKLILFLIK